MEEMKKKLEDKSERDILIQIMLHMEEEKKERKKEIEDLKAEVAEVKETIRKESQKREQENKKLEQDVSKKIQELEQKFCKKEKEKEAEIKKKFKELKTKANGSKDGRSEIDSEATCKKLQTIEKRYDRIEKAKRERCIIIKGLNKERRGLEREIEKFLKERIQVKVRVQEARIIGKTERPMIWAKINTWEEKEEIMRNKNKLGEEKIYIDQDRTKAEREAQKKIVEFSKSEREKGREVKIKFWKMESDGKRYRWSEKESRIIDESGKTGAFLG